jgi:hypothetical protein
MRTENLWTRRSTRAWSTPSCTWRRRGRTYNSVCVSVLVFRRQRGCCIIRPSSRSSGIFDTLLSLGFGTRRPLLLRFMVFQMPTLGVVSIGIDFGYLSVLGSLLVSWSSRKSQV